MTRLTHIDAEQLASGLFEAMQQDRLFANGASFTPQMLAHEAAAQAALLRWAQGHAHWDERLPEAVRQLALAMLADFMIKLQRGDFAGRAWHVPSGLTQAQQARHAIAQELAALAGHCGPPH